MTKTILITGSTDGIGLETAKLLAEQGHNLLIHGRSESKLDNAKQLLLQLGGSGEIETYQADLTDMSEVTRLANEITARHSKLDVLINNAGVYQTQQPFTANGFDVRFIVNTLAPYLLTKQLFPIMTSEGRVVNLSSAAQAPVNLEALSGEIQLETAGQAYAQSKLAITMWSFYLAQQNRLKGPAIIAVNPGSLLASKMVKDAYGIEGKSLSVGAEILVKAALSGSFAHASGLYFDNDSQSFADPHPDALDAEKNMDLVATVESVLMKLV